ncbi:PDDEXK family nuclease [Serinibacter arcticus]|uniref:hypothetical protein n=1 Tax=Serinibacter arcticus TaxID=1655435 RepID=UPI001092194D|nr:hypothetical protein [Serinibacter arcticus]
MRRLTPLNPELARLASAQRGFLTVAQCRNHGLDHRGVARRIASGWVRVDEVVLDTTPDVGSDPQVRRLRDVERALLRAGPGAVAVGLGSLALRGCWGLPHRFDAKAVRRTGTDARGSAQHAVGRTEIVGGRRVPSVPEALIQSLPHLDRLHLVAMLDWALHTGCLASVDELLSLSRGRRGARRLKEWGHEANGLAESQLETWARLQCHDAGLPPPELQVAVHDDAGRLLARGDLGWRMPDGRWLIVEIDGRSVHERAEALLADRHRQNALVGTGRVMILRFTADDLRREGYVPGVIRAALRVAMGLPAGHSATA